MTTKSLFCNSQNYLSDDLYQLEARIEQVCWWGGGPPTEGGLSTSPPAPGQPLTHLVTSEGDDQCPGASGQRGEGWRNTPNGTIENEDCDEIVCQNCYNNKQIFYSVLTSPSFMTIIKVYSGLNTALNAGLYFLLLDTNQ